MEEKFKVYGRPGPSSLPCCSWHKKWPYGNRYQVIQVQKGLSFESTATVVGIKKENRSLSHLKPTSIYCTEVWMTLIKSIVINPET